MTCYVCGSQMPEEARFCPMCGRYYPPTSAPVAASEPAEIPEVAEDLTAPLPDCGGIPVPPIELFPEEQPKRKKRKAVLIPVIIMAVLMTFGSIVFFLLPSPKPESADPTTPAVGQPPQETESATRPQNPGKDEESFRSDDFIPTDESCFLMTDEGLTFLPHKYKGGAVLVIPEEVGGVKVTAIAPDGFTGCEGVTTLILPDTLETVGDRAFAYCAELRGIWFPDSVRTIGEGAFLGCIGLEAVSIPGGMESIGTDAFTGCAKLLYFFYDGYYNDWLELYNAYVTPFTAVSCLDGDYYHGVKTP